MKDIVDVFQVGTRNMYNYELLKTLSDTGKQVILKRGFSSTIDEWLQAAKYIDDSENRVILCERGVRTFESSYRNTLDLNAVSFIKQNTNYKVLVDPSHGTGISSMVEPMSLAAMACGADGLLIESHYKPEIALSDKDQALDLLQLNNIINKLKTMSVMFNKKVVY